MHRRAFVSLATLLLITGLLAVPAAAQSAPEAPPPRCGDGEDTAVLVDASSEPDLYAAYLLAGVLETGCIVDAGDHNGPLPTRRQHCSEVRPTATPSAARPRYRQRSCSPGPNGDAPGEPTGGPRSTSSDAQRATPLRCPAPKPRTATTTGKQTGYTTVSVGRWHSCGLGTDGTVTCWGWNFP